MLRSELASDSLKAGRLLNFLIPPVRSIPICWGPTFLIKNGMMTRPLLLGTHFLTSSFWPHLAGITVYIVIQDSLMSICMQASAGVFQGIVITKTLSF